MKIQQLISFPKELRSQHQKTKILRIISSGTKIFNQFFVFFAIVVLPLLFPQLVVVGDRLRLVICMSFSLGASIFFEVWRQTQESKNKDISLIQNLQIITSVLTLTWFLFLFGGPNGPFFLLYLLTIMESALNLNTTLPNFVVLIAATSVIVDFYLRASHGIIPLTLNEILAFVIRLVSLPFMRSYGLSLAQKLLEEQEAHLKLQKAEEQIRLQLTDLEEKNRFLAALRRLDLIIMEALDLNTLCQKIVNALTWEIKCQFGIIGLVDETENRFYFKAVTEKSNLAKLLIGKRVKLNEVYIPIDGDYNLLAKSIETKREFSTANLVDIFPGQLPANSHKIITKNLQKEVDTKTYWLYPMISKQKVLGVLIFAWEKAERELSSRERDMMQNVVDQTGIALDNTLLYEKLKENVNKLKRANIKLRELDRMKDEFVSIASHELRTPMTSVNNFIWMVLHGKGGKITPKQEFYLDRAAISTQRLINLVEDMLTVSRIEGGKLEMNLVPGDIVKLAKSVIEEVENRANEKKVKLFLEAPKKELPLVMMDADGIREVLINLVSNAIKFTYTKGEVIVSFKSKGKIISTQIADNGRGIAKSDFPKLFKKFGRLERSFATIAETGGTGLGLYICKQIVELHNGKIGVISRLGHGSTFYFDLKVAKK